MTELAEESTVPDSGRAEPRPVEPLPLIQVIAFALPSLPLGSAFLLIAIGLMPFATEVLGVAPAAVGTILLLVRAWDAISDPIAGILSDRTRTRLGRRRPWMIAGVLPFFASVLMLWGPPQLEGAAMTAWLAFAVFCFYTSTTILVVPYYALGAELSPDHNERTRVFGFQQACMLTGTLVAAGLTTWILSWSGEPRVAARITAVSLGTLLALTVAFAVSRVSERDDHQGRGGDALLASMRDVLRNPHARILYGAYFIDNLGAAALGTSAHFFLKYVLEAEELLPLFLAFYVVPGIALIPLVIRLSGRYGKVRVWRVALCIQGCTYLGLAILQAGQFPVACALAVLLSVGSATGQVLAPSVQSDTVDYDELHTGQRKEGAYFAVRNLVYKIGFGLGPFAVGLLFSATGFSGHGEMSETAIYGLRFLAGVMPAIGVFLAVLVLARFKLDAAAHADIREQLDARAAAKQPS